MSVTEQIIEVVERGHALGLSDAEIEEMAGAEIPLVHRYSVTDIPSDRASRRAEKRSAFRQNGAPAGRPKRRSRL